MTGPLDGFKILDLTQVVSGPLATMLLADQGAAVLKVEPVDGLGDMTRLPSFDKGGIGAFYMNNNRGKNSLSLDLSKEEGVADSLWAVKAVVSTLLVYAPCVLVSANAT